MANGGFLIKFNGQEQERCHSCSFDYDRWSYTVNNKDSKPIPTGITKIEIEAETT